MTLEEIRAFFGWMTLINMGLMFYWLLMMVFAKSFVRRVHTKWFSLSEEKFDEIHYRAMAQYKLGIFLFNLVPYLALRIIG